MDDLADSGTLDRPAHGQASRQAFINSVASGALTRWGAQALSWAATLLVARLLSPQDYGIVAMATVMHGLITVISEGGVGMTVVTLRHLSPAHVAQLNTLAVLLGAAGCAVMALLAPAIAAFFGRTEVAPVVAALGATFLVSGFRTIPSALLQRDLRIGAVNAIEAAQAVVGAATTLYGAWSGWGYWALVAGLLAGSAAWTAMLVAARPARFAWPDRGVLGAPLAFTGHQLTGSVAWYWYSNADFVVAGRWLGIHDLGIYSMAWTLARVVPDRIANIVVRATPAFFAAVSHTPDRLRTWLTGITEGLALVCFPLLAVISLNADDVLRLVAGEQWKAAAMPLRLLAIYAMFDIVAQPATRALVAAGDVRFTARLGLVLAIVMPAGFVVGLRWGPTGIACAWLAIAPAVRFAALFRLRSSIGLTVGDLAYALRYPALATMSMVVSMALARETMSGASVLERLGLTMTVGGATYVAVLIALQRQRAVALIRGSLAWRS